MKLAPKDSTERHFCHIWPVIVRVVVTFGLVILSSGWLFYLWFGWKWHEAWLAEELLGESTSFPVREMSQVALGRAFVWMSLALIVWVTIGTVKVLFFRGPRERE